MSKYHENKDIDKLIRKLLSRGWKLLPYTKHFKIQSPGGRAMTVSITPSCKFAIKHIERDVRRIEESEKNGRA